MSSPAGGTTSWWVGSGSAHPRLAEDLATALEVRPLPVTRRRFADGETFVAIDERVRGARVCLVQPTCPPVNDNLWELLLLIDAAVAAEADRRGALLWIRAPGTSRG